MIDKGLIPIRKGIIKAPTFSVYKKGGSVDTPEQLELPLDNPNDNILNFPIKPNMPIYNWFKSEVKKGKKFASKDDLAGYLSKYYSQKQIEKMSEEEVLQKINDLVEKSSYKLIETLGIEIAKICLSDQKVINAKVKIDKPGALRLSKNVGVIISRSKNEN